GAAPKREVVADRAATVGTDSYHCAPQDGEPGILDKGICEWCHYCHVEVADEQLTLRCLSHDSITDERDRLVLTK
ncbi:MAG: hypothetical protein JRH20_21945, partial [Deltaproteobacteria bacterium]|nr:hypothetical protein [Deltaproteobacteria bacterium]